MGYEIVAKIHSSPYGTRTRNLYGTKSPSNAGRARYSLHHLAIPKKSRLKGELISALIEVVGSSPV